jgi:hypothetical protein
LTMLLTLKVASLRSCTAGILQVSLQPTGLPRRPPPALPRRPLHGMEGRLLQLSSEEEGG